MASGGPFQRRRAAAMFATKLARAERIAAQNAVIRDWWPKASAREIGMMVDINAETVVARAVKLGFKPRPISKQPGGDHA